MPGRRWWLGLAIMLAACSQEKKKPGDDAADSAAEARRIASEQRLGELTSQLADASGQLAAANADFAASYGKARTDMKALLSDLDGKATTLKTKAAKLTGYRKKKADAAITEYDRKRNATAAAIAKLPEKEPDAGTAEASIAAITPLMEGTKDAYDVLLRAVGA